MKVILSLIIFTLNAMIGTKSEDFCQSFNDNKNKIDFGFQHKSNYYLFIRQHYWTFSEDMKSLKSNESHFNDIFGSGISMPFLTNTKITGIFRVILNIFNEFNIKYIIKI